MLCSRWTNTIQKNKDVFTSGKKTHLKIKSIADVTDAANLFCSIYLVPPEGSLSTLVRGKFRRHKQPTTWKQAIKPHYY